MAQVHVLPTVRCEHLHEWPGRGLVADAAERFGGEEAHARRLVAERSHECIPGCRISDVAQQPGRLCTDLIVCVLEKW